MIDLNRRQLLTGAAAAGAAAALTSLRCIARARRGAAGRRAGARASIATRSGLTNAPRSTTARVRSRCPIHLVTNVSKDEALAAAEAAYMPKGMVTVPFNPQLINTGSKLILIDTRQRGRQSRADQGRGRPHPAKSCRRRRRSQEHRHRADVASASRPHQRHSRARWLDGIPERRDHGAGGRMGILDERRERRQGPVQRDDEELFRQCEEDLRRHRVQGDEV